jgi:hypothetical protein
MENNNRQNPITQKVAQEIEKGNVKMKPRSYFAFRGILLVTGTIVVLLFAAYLISFIAFSLRVSGLLFLPRFGTSGIGVLFGSLPWLLIGLAAFLVIILEMFAERFEFIHQRPLVYSLFAIIIIVLIGGFLIGNTPLHNFLLYSEQEGHFPVLGNFYRNFDSPDVHNGIVTQVTSTGFVIQTPNSETLNVILSSSVQKDGIAVGDAVVVIGHNQGNTIQASDVKEVEEDLNVFPFHRHLHENSPQENDGADGSEK